MAAVWITTANGVSMGSASQTQRGCDDLLLVILASMSSVLGKPV